MAHIDTSRIPGYAEMTAEEKVAAMEAFEIEDNAAALSKAKDAVSRANSQAAAAKKQNNELLSETERIRTEAAERNAKLEEQVKSLTRAMNVSAYTAKLLPLGFSEDLANKTAAAIADGEHDTIFANLKQFVTDREKQESAAALKKFPVPPAGGMATPNYRQQTADALAINDFASAAAYIRMEQEALNK